jgi:putative FmdB family regulatory protein
VPVHDYVCQSCGSEVEVLHGLNAPGPAACDICGGPMRKRLAPPAIVFRGSGWAKKDARDARASKAGAESKPKAEAESSAKREGSGEARDSSGAAGGKASGAGGSEASRSTREGTSREPAKSSGGSAGKEASGD